MNVFHTWVDLGEKFYDLVMDQSQWSQATFGKDSERGPVGAIKHLQKEAAEVLEAWEKCNKGAFAEECADCLLLLLDLTRRGGIKPMQLIEAAQLKMVVNKSRTWPTPVADTPVEHERQYIVEYSDEQSGFMRHGYQTVIALSPQDAAKKVCGAMPGLYAKSVTEATNTMQTTPIKCEKGGR